MTSQPFVFNAGETTMSKILKTLFRSELTLLMEEGEELSYMRESETLRETMEQLRSRLTSEQDQPWKDYIEKQEVFHDHERQLEFERGFYLGGKLILDVLLKQILEA